MVKIPNKDNIITGCVPGCALDGSIIAQPVTFLGSTVLSFNASLGIGPNQESTLNVELVNDCKISGANDPNHFPNGDHFYGPAKLGGPVFFDTCEAVCLESGSSGCFHFGGILTNYTAQQGNGGLTFNAKVTDPRGLLENAIVIVDSYLEGPIKHRNYFNAFAYYEYNILPTGLKENYPVPTGLTLDPYDTDDVYVTISGAVVGGEFFPPGSFTKADCSVFGTSDRNDRGMTGRKVLQALKNMKPFIYSPNYGEPYKPALSSRDAMTVANKTKHEFNVFRLDMSGFPEPPPYYRVAGPSITILQLLTEICDITGNEFIVWLEKGDPGDPPIIKIDTKKIADTIDPEDMKRTILNFNGASTELSFGEELRIDKNRTILIGEQEHTLIESSDIEFYFGEDSYGNPIVPVVLTDCGFEIALEIDKLNAMLSCPLFDPALKNNNIDLDKKVLKRKVVISEMDIRAALSSMELWKTRVGAANHPETTIKTVYPTHDTNTVDFNSVIGYNFNSILTTQISDIVKVIAKEAGQLLESQKKRIDDFTDNSPKGIVDAAHSANQIYVKTLMDNKAKDLDTIYDFIVNLGRTYYGKQYLVALPTGVCAISAGLYDENYFGLGSESVLGSYTGIYVPPQCSGEITDPNQVKGKIYRETIYSHIPINAGGWAEPCVPVLGLYEPELSFFKNEDFRVQPFARFDTKDVRITYKTGFIYNPQTSNYMFHYDDSYGTNKPPRPQIEATTTVIKGVCGELDVNSLSDDTYIMITDHSGICNLPNNSGYIYPIYGSGFEVVEQNVTNSGDVPVHVWLKCEVDEKLYIISGCPIIQDGVPGIPPVPWQTHDPYADCYWSGPGEPVGYCVPGTPAVPEIKGCQDTVKAIIRFNDACMKKSCAEAEKTSIRDIILLWSELAGYLMTDGNPSEQAIIKKINNIVRDTASKNLCGLPNSENKTPLIARSSLDTSSINNKGFCPSADIPTAVVIPVRSNINTYGPWYSSNFKTSSGGISFDRDNELAPWNYGSKIIMDDIATKIVEEAQISLSEIETGSITHPGMPLLSLGFLDNGPNLTNVNVVFGGGGITSNYSFQTYTPRLGALRNLQNQQLKESMKNRQRAQRIVKDRLIQENKINRKIKNIPNSNGITAADKTKEKLHNQGTLQRVLVGEIYDWSIIKDHTYVDPSGNQFVDTPIVLGADIIGSGQRTVVGTDTLEKSALEMRFNYSGKAFMSWDGLLSPVSLSGDGNLPMFSIKYTGYPLASKSTSIAPLPPIIVITGNRSGSSDIKINQNYLNPLTNNFGVSGHHHNGPGAGHVIDIVGRGSGIPGTGMIMNFYGQQDWKNRYAQDYRFLGLKGPLVLHAWGYDTQGKPIPNNVDIEKDIRDSGIYKNSGLKDQFLPDWLHKPSTWPVAPVDLRFDRERGVWVSPPQHKIVVAKVTEPINPYGSGSGVLINQYDDKKYGQPIYDGSGNLISASGDNSNAKINIVDRIGNTLPVGSKGYAYFDSFTSQYLMLGGITSSSIRLGTYNPSGGWSKLFRPYFVNGVQKFTNVKKVKLFEASKNPEAEPWELMAEKDQNGNDITVNVMNLFSYLPGYQTDSEKFCLIMKLSDTGGEQDDPNNKEFWILIAAEC